MSFKVLTYRPFSEEQMKIFAENDIEVVMGQSDQSEDGIVSEIGDVDALLVSRHPENGFNKRIIDAGKRLKLIDRGAVGYETIDIDYAAEQGIYVTNTAGINRIAVAEGTIMMMIGCSRDTQKTTIRWYAERKDFPMANSFGVGHELFGKTLGLIGCGNIGSTVASIAANGFQMKVLGYDPYAKSVPDYITLVDNMEDMLKEADYVSLHIPSMPSTYRSIGMDNVFSKMKPTAYFLNAARGNIIREDELITALQNHVIAGAGLDVFEYEYPIRESSYPLFECDNVFLLPHCTGKTAEAFARGAACVTQHMVDCANGREPQNVVNGPVKNPRLFRK